MPGAAAGVTPQVGFRETHEGSSPAPLPPQVAQLPLFVSDGKWHHICVTWTTRDGMWEAFQDGEKLGTGENLAPWHPIKPRGVLILGQEQVCTGREGHPSPCSQRPEGPRAGSQAGGVPGWRGRFRQIPERSPAQAGGRVPRVTGHGATGPSLWPLGLYQVQCRLQTRGAGMASSRSRWLRV